MASTATKSLRIKRKMTVRDIVIYPDHRLRAPTVEVEVFDENLNSLIDDLRDTMYTHNAVGIAAIQIGRPERVFLIDPLRACGERAKEFADPLVLINPTIEVQSTDLVSMEEGCLSFPGVYVNIKRPSRTLIRAKVRNANNEWEDDKMIEAIGLFARALQHECDHLRGRLLIDMLSFTQKRRINKRFRK